MSFTLRVNDSLAAGTGAVAESLMFLAASNFLSNQFNPLFSNPQILRLECLPPLPNGKTDSRAIFNRFAGGRTRALKACWPRIRHYSQW